MLRQNTHQENANNNLEDFISFMPTEIIVNIFSFLKAKDIAITSLVCKEFKNINNKFFTKEIEQAKLNFFNKQNGFDYICNAIRYGTIHHLIYRLNLYKESINLRSIPEDCKSKMTLLHFAINLYRNAYFNTYLNASNEMLEKIKIIISAGIDSTIKSHMVVEMTQLSGEIIDTQDLGLVTPLEFAEYLNCKEVIELLKQEKKVTNKIQSRCTIS